MDDIKKILPVLAILLGLLIPLAWWKKSHDIVDVAPPPVERQIEPPEPEPPKVPTQNISVKTPKYLPYPELVEQLKTWNKEAPDLTEVGIYGKSAAGKDIYYIRVTNKFNTERKPIVLITGCIHGNEPWCTSCVMAYIGRILGHYGTDEKITELVNTRDIWFAPVVSPDSYPHSRHVNGVDPNRDFPGPHKPDHQSVPPVKAIQDLFTKIQPNAVISAHTYGRVFLYPMGDTTQRCPQDAEFQRIIGETARLCQYRMMRACELYGTPIRGSEVDWYYRGGAFSVVMEHGSHQTIPSMDEIIQESDRCFDGVLYFIKEAPLVKLRYSTLVNYSIPQAVELRLPQSSKIKLLQYK